MTVVLETPRLQLRHAQLSDASFILELVTDPDWLANIGDRGVRNIDDARRYIETQLLSMYEAHGFGLWVVTDRSSGSPMGLCGILKRPSLEDADLGYAFLPSWRGQGYAAESAAGVLRHAHEKLDIERLVAITLPENIPSTRLLLRLGFVLESEFRLPDDDDLLHLYAWQAGPVA